MLLCDAKTGQTLLVILCNTANLTTFIYESLVEQRLNVWSVYIGYISAYISMSILVCVSNRTNNIELRNIASNFMDFCLAQIFHREYKIYLKKVFSYIYMYFKFKKLLKFRKTSNKMRTFPNNYRLNIFPIFQQRSAVTNAFVLHHGAQEH